MDVHVGEQLVHALFGEIEPVESVDTLDGLDELLVLHLGRVVGNDFERVVETLKLHG